MKYVKDERLVAPRLPFSSLSTAVGRDVFQSGRRKGVESSAQERIGDEVIERRSLMKRRKSVGDRTEP